MLSQNPIEQLIQDEIREHGPLTFARFMELALYHPEWGYYRPQRTVVGKAGDFITSVSSTPLFGRLLGSALGAYGGALGFENTLKIHEFGAHRGQLKDDILKVYPEFEYQTYEVGDLWPEQMNGCVVANELLDALPFHRVHVQQQQWRELFVGIGADNKLGWVSGDLSTPALEQGLAGLPVQHMEGYHTEVSLAMRHWIAELGKRLTRGFAILIDYGHETHQYFAPSRARGGLRTFTQHRRGDDPFEAPGEQDITCDVHFSDVIDVAAQCGLSVWEFAEQGRFFTRQATRQLLAAPGAGALTEQDARALMTLTHPAHLGMAFKVLVLGRGERPLGGRKC